MKEQPGAAACGHVHSHEHGQAPWINLVGSEIAANPYARKAPMLAELAYIGALRDAGTEESDSIALPAGMSLDEVAGYVTFQQERIKMAGYLLSDTEARLGCNFAGKFAALDDGQKIGFLNRFDAAYSELPERHPRYELADKYHHGHAHDDDRACRTIVPGIGTRAVRWVERKLAGKMGESKRLRAAFELGSRLVLFSLCPGDDFAALGMHTVGALTGHAGHGQHQEVQGILPRRPRIDFESGKIIVSLPADALVRHSELPQTRQADVVREHTMDPPATACKPKRGWLHSVREKWAKQNGAEQRRPTRRLRAALAVGAAATSLGLGLASDSADQGEAPQPPAQFARATAEPQPLVPDVPPIQPESEEDVFVPARVAPGESQWSLAEQLIEDATGQSPGAGFTKIVTALAAAENQDRYPNPHDIRPGHIEMLAPEVIKDIQSVFANPAEASARLVADLAELRQAPWGEIVDQPELTGDVLKGLKLQEVK